MALCHHPSTIRAPRAPETKMLRRASLLTKASTLKTRVQYKHSTVGGFASLDPFTVSSKQPHTVQNLGKRELEVPCLLG